MQTKEVILVFETNAWHNFDSRETIGIATTEEQRDKLVRKHLRSLHKRRPSLQLETQAINEIRTNGQTQCLAERCDIEIDTERVNLDEYLL
jgi:hypothetical protein